MEILEGSNTLGVLVTSRVLGWVLAITIAYYVGMGIYNIFFHPLRRFPGPKLYAASRIPYSIDTARGTMVSTIDAAHKKYGDVVRIAPDELSFISEKAWQDIYGFRGQRKPEMVKDRTWYAAPPNGVHSIITAAREDHARVRRVFSHAFSDKALKEQEPLVQGYFDTLIRLLHEKAEKGVIADMVRYYNFTTFDIIGDFTLGESFGCLEKDNYHTWVAAIFASLRVGAYLNAIRYHKALQALYTATLPRFLEEKRMAFFKFAEERVHRRLKVETDRPDLVTLYQRTPESRELTVKELESTSQTLLIAGSETTATMLSGTTYLLLKHPEIMKKLVAEIRETFSSQDEITIARVSTMPYLLAVLSESLRYYPPVPTGFPRVVPEGGESISGHYVPEKTSVYVSQWSANHSPTNFVDPDSFLPERWLGKDPRFVNDKKGVYNPFSHGPRNCIGKNLAYAEMRVILAKVLWNFDMELCDDKTDWFDQKVFRLWEKPALNVRLTARRL
ncbi:uncharacterized protein K452DRAFT_282310 [Aplosporella prunicola CBS 121167]|uniref:Cytochrome P450 monooxygenase n=1 Tax=Aplosporella prunicola CBS 121167 TaxID=1176127 RepID=A0A6A6BT60_9PEZI|nr:uncharacterized protein K452DRAFT_282310 [Aplosporella prunicola CBS 121167]KAF2147309.1 hypothetical protein K452DRAFT_282310 [Aplosporella prunicola CBS 121167]